MAYLPPEDRHQLRIRSLDECISKDHLVRFIDAFVDQLDLPKLGFIVADVKTEGRPAFDPKVFLKLYLYGYLNPAVPAFYNIPGGLIPRYSHNLRCFPVISP